jgi:hypothetical protein
MPAGSPDACAEQTSYKAHGAEVARQACAKAGTNNVPSMANSTSHVPPYSLRRRALIQPV